jgi:hypothetical protein
MHNLVYFNVDKKIFSLFKNNEEQSKFFRGVVGLEVQDKESNVGYVVKYSNDNGNVYYLTCSLDLSGNYELTTESHEARIFRNKTIANDVAISSGYCGNDILKKKIVKISYNIKELEGE